MNKKNKAGFIAIPLIFLIVGIIIVGYFSYKYSEEKNTTREQTSSLPTSFDETFSPYPTQFHKITTPTAKANVTSNTTTTYKPTTKPVTKTSTPVPTSPLTNQATNNPTLAPEPTQNYSTEKPTLDISDLYTVGESGPCFDLTGHHSSHYLLAAEFTFDATNVPYNYTSMHEWGSDYKATVCWAKDATRTGKQYVFKARPYTDATPIKIYGDEVTKTYIHP